MPGVRIESREYGDAGLLVDVSADDDEAAWSATQALGAALRDARPAGFVDVVASYRSVFVSFDPLLTDHAAMGTAVTGLLDRPATPRIARRFTIPVVYGGQHGPDLADVAHELGTDPEAVVRLHTSADWVVRFVASPVGAPMLDRPATPDGPWLPASVRRLTDPRAVVEPGSVGISGFQSIVYPAASPGGWRLIGRTPASLFDLERPPHVPYAPGDRLLFQPIDAADWDAHMGPPTTSAPEAPA